ncbi:MAG: anthranilate phosphoribosyltransferase [Lysobacterales bacterium]
MLSPYLPTLVEGRHLEAAEMEAAMQSIMGGHSEPVQLAAFLVALRMKGETVTEIAAAARVMRSLARPVPWSGEGLLDIVGTGGDGASLFNVSTAAAFVAAAGGARVAKHGNRSVSSSSGSADLLEAAGARLELSAERVGDCLQASGFGFLFAPSHHAAMRHAAPVRKALGLRTLFNLLGPLTNPAGATQQVLGVYDGRWVQPLAEVLRELGARHVLVVHAEDGLDEISLAAPTQVAELRDGQVRCRRIEPEDLGVRRQSLDGLQVGSPAESLALIRRVLAGEPGPAADLVALNAGAALYAADCCDSLADGVAQARVLLATGAAAERLQTYVAESQREVEA